MGCSTQRRPHGPTSIETLRAGVMTCRRITTPVTALYVADWALPSSDRHSTCQPTGQPGVTSRPGASPAETASDVRVSRAYRRATDGGARRTRDCLGDDR